MSVKKRIGLIPNIVGDPNFYFIKIEISQGPVSGPRTPDTNVPFDP
jgi:hypothetical protein